MPRANDHDYKVVDLGRQPGQHGATFRCHITKTKYTNIGDGCADPTMVDGNAWEAPYSNTRWCGLSAAAKKSRLKAYGEAGRPCPNKRVDANTKQNNSKKMLTTNTAGGSPSPRGRLLPFTPAKRTSLAAAAAAVFSSPPASDSKPPVQAIASTPTTSDLLCPEIGGTTPTAGNDVDSTVCQTTAYQTTAVTPISAEQNKAHTSNGKCSEAGCTKLGGFRAGMCQRHYTTACQKRDGGGKFTSTASTSSPATTAATPSFTEQSKSHTSGKGRCFPPTGCTRDGNGQFKTTASASSATAATAVTPSCTEQHESHNNGGKRCNYFPCSVAGCTKLGGFSEGKCREHFAEDMAANGGRRSKRQPKRSRIEIMEEFEAKSELYQMKPTEKSEQEEASEAEAEDYAMEDHNLLEMPPQSDWRETMDESSGKPYYYHIDTQEVTWDKPACLAAQEKHLQHKNSLLRSIIPDLLPGKQRFEQPRGITQIPTSGKWTAQIFIAGRTRNIGSFADQTDAVMAFQLVRSEMDQCGLLKMDERRHDDFEVAKQKAREAVLKAGSAAKSGQRGPYKPKSSADALKDFPGVSFVRSGKFQAQLFYNGKTSYIGTFPTAEEAAYARNSVKTAIDAEMDTPEVDLDDVFESAKAEALEMLRITSSPEEGVPFTKDASTKWMGVTSKHSGSYQAQIYFNSKREYIGSFTTSEAASFAYTSIRMAIEAKKNTPGVDLDNVYETAKGKAMETLRILSGRDEIVPGKGIMTSASGRFQAQMYYRSARGYIGTFKTLEEATYAYISISSAIEANKKSPGFNFDDFFKSAKAEAVETLRDAFIFMQGDTPSKANVAPKAGRKPPSKSEAWPNANGMPRGVRKRSTGKYETQIQYGDKRKYIGCFGTAREAAEAYAFAKKSLNMARYADRGDASFDQLKAAAWKAAEKVAVKVGTRIGVYWDLDRVYYPATVTAMASKHIATVLYDDGHVDEHDFFEDEIKFLPASSASVRSKTGGAAAKKAENTKKKKECEHCGRFFFPSGLVYHLENKVCLKKKVFCGRALEAETIADAAATAESPAPSPVKVPHKKPRLKKHQCQHCGQMFTTGSGLQYHLTEKVCLVQKQVTRIRPKDHQCQHCGRMFTMEGLQYHTKEKVCLKGSDTSKRVSTCESL